MLLTFGLLGAAIVAVWLPNVAVAGGRQLSPWQALFVAAVTAGLAGGVLSWPAIPVLAVTWAAARASVQPTQRSHAGAWTALTAVLALALATHQLPGFTSQVVASDVTVSAGSVPMTLRANFDKGAAGLILLVYCCRGSRSGSGWPTVVGTGVGIGAVTAALVIALVAGTGAIHFDPKLPAITLPWLATNLMLTSLMEEAFFRGVLQDRMTVALRQRPRLRYMPVALASVLFGLAHLGGGPLLMLAATVAGVGYGIAYARSGRIEAAVLAHFTLNTIHFLGFTYPYAAR